MKREAVDSIEMLVNAWKASWCYNSGKRIHNVDFPYAVITLVITVNVMPNLMFPEVLMGMY